MPDRGPTISPTLRYRDARAAITFLEQAFGFEPAAVHEGPDGEVAHAELAFDGGLVMLGTAADQTDGAPYWGAGPPPGVQSIYVVVGDAQAHHARAVAAGATIERPLGETGYGSTDYSARDPEGHLWNFGTYRPAPAS
ncbi:MAG: VOC family protein [Solirubrobacteraceae bacterium]